MDAPPPVWHGLAAGACSTLASRFFTYPPDTVKARLQLQGSGGSSIQYSSTLDAFRKIAAREGITGFYRGFGGIMLTVIPANMCYFGGYELGKRITPRNLGVLSDMMTALLAQTIAGTIYCPIDIVKQRVQTQTMLQPGSRLSPLRAAQMVYRNQGLPGFFKGFLAMNGLWLPWNLIYLSLYEESKRQVYYWQLRRLKAGAVRMPEQDGVALLQDLPMQQVLPLWAFPLCSATCASIAAVCTHPIDVAKTRLQVLSTRTEKAAAGSGGGGGGSGSTSSSSGGGSGSTQRLSFRQVALDLYRQEGLRGFSRGMAARVATISTGSAVSWFTYETVKRKLAQWEGAAAAAAHGSS